MIARVRDWLFRRHVDRHMPDPTFGPRMIGKRRQGIARKQEEIANAQALGLDYAEINRAAFGRPPYTKRGERP